MSKPIPQDYTLSLKLPSGTMSWQIKDSYFERRWIKLARHVLEAIQECDKAATFSLNRLPNPHDLGCPWNGVDLNNDMHMDIMDDTPCLCSHRSKQ